MLLEKDNCNRLYDLKKILETQFTVSISFSVATDEKEKWEGRLRLRYLCKREWKT